MLKCFILPAGVLLEEWASGQPTWPAGRRLDSSTGDSASAGECDAGFVGRMELVTAATKREVKDAIAGNDRATLAQYARFLRPIADRILADSAPADRAGLERAVTTCLASINSAGGCN